MQKVFRSALREIVSKRFFYIDYKPPWKLSEINPYRLKALLKYTTTPYKDV